MLHLHQRIITQITITIITTTIIIIIIIITISLLLLTIILCHPYSSNSASPPGSSYVPTPTSLRFHPFSSPRHPTAFSMLHVPSGAATHRQHGTGHAVPVAQAVKGRRRRRRLRWGESVKPTARVLCIYRNYVMYDIIYIYKYIYIFIYWQSLEDNCLAKRFSKCTADNQYYLCFTRSHPFISFYHQPKWLKHMSLIRTHQGTCWARASFMKMKSRHIMAEPLYGSTRLGCSWPCACCMAPRALIWAKKKLKTTRWNRNNENDLWRLGRQWQWVFIKYTYALVYLYIHIYDCIYTYWYGPFPSQKHKTCRMNKNAIMSHAKSQQD